MTIEIADLGDWGRASLLAEYDAENDAIRIDARAVAMIRAALGEAQAQRFIACATAHELFHRANPFASEREATLAGAAATGADLASYVRVLRS